MSEHRFDPATDPETREAYERANQRESDEKSPKPRRALPPLRDGDWIASNIQPLPEELIRGLLHKGSKMVLGGGSKGFKTWVLIDLAISVSTGSPWWGLETVAGPVAYLNFEIAEPFFDSRLREVAAAKDVELGKNLKVWSLRGYAEAAVLLLPELAKKLKGEGLAAIIIDPVYKLALGTEENSATETAQLMQLFENFAEGTGAAVAFGAHFSKGNQAGKEAMDRISGSGVYARDPDAILTMTQHTEEGAFTVDATLRNCPPMPPFAVRWEFPLMVLAPDLNPADLKQVKAGGKRTFSVDDIVNVLPLRKPQQTTQWRDLAAKERGIGKSRFYELKKDLEISGHPKVIAQNGEFTRVA